MEPRQLLSHWGQTFFAKHLFHARKNLVLFQAHMVVKESGEAGDVTVEWHVGCEARFEILDQRANFRVLRQHPQDVLVFVNARTPRISREQDLLFLAEMHAPVFLPELHECLRRFSDGIGAARAGGFRCATHFERLHQRVMMMLAQRMETWVTLHDNGENGTRGVAQQPG